MPAKYTLDIGLEGPGGAGRDPEYGKACVRAHADEIRAAVEKQLSGADPLLVCAGLGGGTGSVVGELVRVLEDLDVPILAVTTLPSASESGITKVNAIKAVNQLVTSPLSGRIFIDNDRLVEAFPDLDVVSYYPAVNAKVLSPLDEMNRLNAREDVWSIRTFDGEDLRKVLLSGGVLQTHVAKLDEKRPLDADELVRVVSECVGGGAHLAQGLTLAEVAYLALVIVGPERALRATPMRGLDETIQAIKDKSGGGAVYEGIFVSGDDVPLKAYVLAASLGLPARIAGLLGDAESEGRELARKIREDLPELEISPLEGLELFRAPHQRARAPEDRPKAPKPRPLAEQLCDLSRVGPAPKPEPEAAAPKAEEPTLYVDGEPKPPRPRTGISERLGLGAFTPRVGTGKWDEEAEAEAEAQEPTAMVPDPGSAPAPAVLKKNEALPKAPGPAAPLKVTDAAALPERHPFIDDDQGGADKTRTDARLPSFLRSSESESALLSSIVDSSTTELQAVYEDLIDRFRQAADRRDKERVARRLIDDSRAKDVEVRALAVWAMVKLEDPGFKRALVRAAGDENPEISKLATSGLERLGG